MPSAQRDTAPTADGHRGLTTFVACHCTILVFTVRRFLATAGVLAGSPSGRGSSPSRDRQTQAAAMPAHRFFLVREKPDIGARIRAAEQHKAGGAVFRVEAQGLRLIHLPPLQTSGAANAPTLKTGEGQIQSGPRSRREQVFVGGCGNRGLACRRDERHAVAPLQGL